jgi:hypothetical protein
MDDVVQKPEKENPLGIVRNQKDMLLIRVQSFTSKDVSDACREMSEKNLERVADICQKLSDAQLRPSAAAIALVNLAKVASDEQFKTCTELGMKCIEKQAQPPELFNTLTYVLQKNPTSEQFNKITSELSSKIIPSLKFEYETAMPFVTDWVGDEKRFVTNRPEWTLSHISDKAKTLSLDEFINFLPTISAEAPKKEIQNPALEEIKSNYVEISDHSPLVVVVGGQKYRPNIQKHHELLAHFKDLLDKVKSPEDLAELRKAFAEELYSEHYASKITAQVFNEWRERSTRFANDDIAKRWIPNELGVLLSRMSAIRDEKGPEDAQRIMEALKKNNIGFETSLMPWPKDGNMLITDASGKLQGYIRNVPSDLPRYFVGEGGMGVSGPGFIVFSDSAKANEVNVLKILQPDLRIYELPAAYTTYRLPLGETTKEKPSNPAEEDVLLATAHIDTVMGVIPKSCTKDGRPILLIDPRYYKELRENPVYNMEFERLLTEQGLTDRLVVIPQDEAYLNPANIGIVRKEGKEYVVINEAQKTIEMLREKGMKEDSMIVVKVEEMHAFRGSIGCFLSCTLPEDVIGPHIA